jgi:small subunit ribosomal protein S7
VHTTTHGPRQPNTSTMPPMNPFSALRTLPIRHRPAAAFRANFQRPAACRFFADNSSTNNPGKLPKAEGEPAVGPNMQQQEHVSEEAAKMAAITGSEGPDLGQGTPVQEVRLDYNCARRIRD